MSEQLEGSAGRTFLKWTDVGQEIMVRITEAPVFDRPNRFGKTDSYIVGEGPDGDKVQVPLLTDAAAKVKKALPRLDIGKTVITVKFTGTKPMAPGKAPMKVFSVSADYLKPA